LLSSAWAGDPCEKAIQRAEKTGRMTFSVGDIILTHSDTGTTWATTFYREGRGPPLNLDWTMAVKLVDGTSLQIGLTDKVSPSHRTDETGTLSYYEPVLTVSAEQAESLAASPVDATRVDLGSKNNPAPFPKGRAKKLHEAFTCIASQQPAE
jgi:hypothetical protein